MDKQHLTPSAIPSLKVQGFGKKEGEDPKADMWANMLVVFANRNVLDTCLAELACYVGFLIVNI